MCAVIGLSTPLILSSMALDITLDGACQLIRSYLADRQAWAYGAFALLAPGLQQADTLGLGQICTLLCRFRSELTSNGVSLDWSTTRGAWGDVAGAGTRELTGLAAGNEAS